MRSHAEELSRAEVDLFETHVRPTLVRNCLKCHGERKQEGGLRVTALEDLLRGGDSGAAVVPGKPDESLLIEALRYESFEMPPAGPLEESVVDGLVAWIEAGAPWPSEVTLTPTAKITQADRDWWCYQPVTDPPPPAVNDPAKWCRNPIDQFVLHRLQQQSLEPAEEAGPVALARRVHFALTGLPPDAPTIDAVASESFDYEALVDRLLLSEDYGRHQARFWLDLVRYAESDGYRADHDRPHAHRYRDYVIDAFNSDKPYDQFVREQLAGDEIDPGNEQALVATMYLRHWIYEHNQRDVETQWHEILGDITETTSDVFLAQGLKCARCHDHKFDPLLQKDYFRMKAFFAAFQPTEDQPVADVDRQADYLEQLRAWELATDSIRRQLRELEHPVLLKHATREGFDKFIPKIKSMIRKYPSDRLPYEHQIASMASRQYDLPRKEIDKWLNEEQKAEREKLLQALAEFEKLKPKPLRTIAFVASDVGAVAPATVIPDDSSEEEIEPGFPTLLDPEPATITPPPDALQSTGRRTALANWITRADNPLTARVIVNRIWQQHFGRGLVETASDFGRLGSPPSHPQLLDWLATRLVEDGWSLKKLHRLILTSATYRQTSLRRADEQINLVDPGNRLWWRFNPRRLSGEELHDAVLAASGELTSGKRAIYKPVKRNTPDPLLAAFDGPDRIRSIGKRHRTTTSTQALLLANGKWIHERASAIARRVGPAADDEEPSAIVTRLYRRLFARSPESEEIEMALQFLRDYAETVEGDSKSDTAPQSAAEVALVHALLNSNEMIYVD